MRSKLSLKRLAQKCGTRRFTKRVVGVENNRFWGNFSRKYQKKKRVNRLISSLKKTGRESRFGED
ncbi:hypothetical protein FD733_08680 [Pantoea sp. Eser]|nr:hypothetical protein [Pantoea sp. Eser]